MSAYKIVTRVTEIAQDLWHVSASASMAATPRQGLITREHECASREQAIDFLEILVDQVRVAVEATGGDVVGVTSAD